MGGLINDVQCDHWGVHGKVTIMLPPPPGSLRPLPTPPLSQIFTRLLASKHLRKGGGGEHRVAIAVMNPFIKVITHTFVSPFYASLDLPGASQLLPEED
eukprot:jgi/Botrbrau1/15454/Bobra.43_2s0078.1